MAFKTEISRQVIKTLAVKGLRATMSSAWFQCWDISAF